MDGDVVDPRCRRGAPELGERLWRLLSAAPRGRVVGEDLDRRRADLLGAIRGLEHSLTEGQVGADQSAVGVVRHGGRC